MAVSDEQALKLFNDIKTVCLEIIRDAHAFIGTHDLKRSPLLMDKYPGLCNDFFFDDRYFNEDDRNNIPFLKHKIKKYEMKSYPEDKKYYTAIFDGYGTERINLKDYEKIDDIKAWINSEPEILKIFTEKDELSDYTIRGLVNDIVERYLYVTNASDVVPDNIDDIINPYIVEKILFYLEDILEFDICVPICLATFRKSIKLEDGVEIVEISDELQKSRQIACKYEVNKEDWVAACATHMIVFHDYNYQKNEHYSFNSVINDYSCYPLEKIDEVMGIIRVATGYEIGYEHILCIPKGWVKDTTADLCAVYGAKSHFVNHKYVKRDWMNLPVSVVSEEQCDNIISLYKGYRENDKKLKFSLVRLNRCVLRDEVDDMTTDACIGLESLLSGGAHSEITNAIASRIPFVLSKTDLNQYSPAEGRAYMKKIYNLRSRIVHGDELKDKDIYYGTGEDKIYIPKMAVEFLRIVLKFMIENPKYIKVEEIDSYIDKLVVNP